MTRIEDILRGGPGAEPPVGRFVERAREAGLLDVAYGHVDSPLGRLLVAVTPRGLVRIAYPDREPDAVLEDLARRVSPRVLEEPSSLDEVRRQLEDYFAGRRRGFDLAVDLSAERGFGARVLRAAAEIPHGEVTTYKELAARAGSPRAARATGNALGANRIPIVVPCHRVVHSGGGMGGYTGGLERKEFLLRLEGWPGAGPG